MLHVQMVNSLVDIIFGPLLSSVYIEHPLIYQSYILIMNIINIIVTNKNISKLMHFTGLAYYSNQIFT